MMRQFELVERVQRYNPATDEELLNKAYVYAMKAHGGQKRASGDPYFSHPLEVAAILTDLHMDDSTIAAALLHDVVEDTEHTLKEVQKIFGDDIARLVDGVTKLNRLELVSKKATQAENLRKLLLAISTDVRVLLIKLADRLHNIRTLHHVPPEKRVRIAEETLDIYAPLAARMGMQHLREEFEDNCFQALQPQAYEAITQKMAILRVKNAKLIETIASDLRNKLQEKGITAKVTWREKSPFSIWRKMESKALSFEQLSDVYGFRILVDTMAECYQALGIIHTTWPMVPGRFKDYISIPKENDYQSLHTTIVGPGRQRVELQVRTHAMHEIAEYGIAAHSLYKTGESGTHVKLETESRAFAWLKRTVEMLVAGDSPEEFLEHTKLELFQDQVFCFTPKGRLIALPRGAKPMDFAYALHTTIGNECIGCKINGQMAPLTVELRNGDEVEILTAKGHVPMAAWESLVATGKARAAIRRATRQATRARHAELGRQLLKRYFQRQTRIYDEDKILAVLPKLARSSVEELLAAVGHGDVSADDVVRAVYPDYTRPKEAQPAILGERRKDHIGAGSEYETIEKLKALCITGVESDMSIHFAQNTSAIPGDRIVGILEPDHSVTIYPIHAPVLASLEQEPERWVDVRWSNESEGIVRFPTKIKITVLNEPGVLAQVTQVTGDADANIQNIHITNHSRAICEILIDLEVYNLKHLASILAQLKTKPVVTEAQRVYA